MADKKILIPGCDLTGKRVMVDRSLPSYQVALGDRYFLSTMTTVHRRYCYKHELFKKLLFSNTVILYTNNVRNARVHV